MPPDDVPRISAIYTHQLDATDDDIDQLGHVSNLVYLKWVLEAARLHSEDVGWDMATYLEHGTVFVVRRHEIEYLRPAFAGDTIELHTWIEKWTGATSVRCTRIERQSDGVELARARTIWALVALPAARPVRIPVVLREAFIGDTIPRP